MSTRASVLARAAGRRAPRPKRRWRARDGERTWHVTASVWHSWLLPVRNSPMSSVMAPVSIPPPRSVSSVFEPVEMHTSSDRRAWNSVAVVKPSGTSLEAGGGGGRRGRGRGGDGVRDGGRERARGQSAERGGRAAPSSAQAGRPLSRSRASDVMARGRRGGDAPSVRILSALASEIPLYVMSCFLGVNATASTVLRADGWARAGRVSDRGEIGRATGRERARRRVRGRRGRGWERARDQGAGEVADGA